MRLGAFSISLNVQNLSASQAFYEKLGFAVIGGEAAHGYLILRNPDDVVIGLFQGMFERNTLTFNPGWNQRCEHVDPFTDVRALQAQLEALGLTPTTGVDPSATSGPGYLTLTDPDGNPVLIDQHR
jgi:catechol 2,3-dioxygenase-like lactoylglutathione lyase family enzyme